MQTMYDSDKRKLLSALCHGSIFLSLLVAAVGIPIVINMISDDPVVKDNAKEAINFHFNVWFWGGLIGGIATVIGFLTLGLSWLLFGPILGIGFLLHWGLSVWAIAHSLGTPDTPFRYPFIFRLL